jgi:hypothetical protein
MSEYLFMFHKDVHLYQGIPFDREGNASFMLSCLENGTIKACNKDSINFIFAILAMTGDETFELESLGEMSHLGKNLQGLKVHGDITSQYCRNEIVGLYCFNRDNSGCLNSFIGSEFQKYAVPLN